MDKERQYCLEISPLPAVLAGAILCPYLYCLHEEPKSMSEKL